MGLKIDLTCVGSIEVKGRVLEHILSILGSKRQELATISIKGVKALVRDELWDRCPQDEPAKMSAWVRARVDDALESRLGSIFRTVSKVAVLIPDMKGEQFILLNRGEFKTLIPGGFKAVYEAIYTRLLLSPCREVTSYKFETMDLFPLSRFGKEDAIKIIVSTIAEGRWNKWYNSANRSIKKALPSDWMTMPAYSDIVTIGEYLSQFDSTEKVFVEFGDKYFDGLNIYNVEPKDEVVQLRAVQLRETGIDIAKGLCGSSTFISLLMSRLGLSAEFGTISPWNIKSTGSGAKRGAITCISEIKDVGNSVKMSSQIIRNMPDNASVEDLMAKTYVTCEKLARGVHAVNIGGKWADYQLMYEAFGVDANTKGAFAMNVPGMKCHVAGIYGESAMGKALHHKAANVRVRGIYAYVMPDPCIPPFRGGNTIIAIPGGMKPRKGNVMMTRSPLVTAGSIVVAREVKGSHSNAMSVNPEIFSILCRGDFDGDAVNVSHVDLLPATWSKLHAMNLSIVKSVRASKDVYADGLDTPTTKRSESWGWKGVRDMIMDVQTNGIGVYDNILSSLFSKAHDMGLDLISCASSLYGLTMKVQVAINLLKHKLDGVIINPDLFRDECQQFLGCKVEPDKILARTFGNRIPDNWGKRSPSIWRMHEDASLYKYIKGPSKDASPEVQSLAEKRVIGETSTILGYKEVVENCHKWSNIQEPHFGRLAQMYSVIKSPTLGAEDNVGLYNAVSSLLIELWSKRPAVKNVRGKARERLMQGRLNSEKDIDGYGMSVMSLFDIWASMFRSDSKYNSQQIEAIKQYLIDMPHSIEFYLICILRSMSLAERNTKGRIKKFYLEDRTLKVNRDKSGKPYAMGENVHPWSLVEQIVPMGVWAIIGGRMSNPEWSPKISLDAMSNEIEFGSPAEEIFQGKYGEKDKAKWDRSDLLLANLDSKGSTGRYVKNLPNWNGEENKVLFISVNGKRKDRAPLPVERVMDALHKGCSFVTDNPENRNRDYNVGERNVADILSKWGCKETPCGDFSVWTKSPQ